MLIGILSASQFFSSMPNKKMKEIISITREAMNTDKAYVFGLVVKLEYYFPQMNSPKLEIFLDDDEAKSKEWYIYGTDPEASSDRVAKVEFSGLNEMKEFRLGNAQFRITFINLGQKEIDYPRGGQKMERMYQFVIESANL